MKNTKRVLTMFGTILLLLCAAMGWAQQNATMTFDNLKDLELVGNYYNGGYGSLGSGPGPNYGVTFNVPAQVLVSHLDGGGQGDFLNEPSPHNIVFFPTNTGGFIINVANGFQNGLTFYYAATLDSAVSLYSDFNGKGTLVLTLPLPAIARDYKTWQRIQIPFTGTVKSAVFSGYANYVAYDNISFGLLTHVKGSISLEGVGDLSLISAYAPLNPVQVELRLAGATPAAYHQNATLYSVSGSANGSFSVDAAPGTYDVWVKGDKNLAAVLTGVIISGTTTTLTSIALPAGDANNDNSVDSADFGLLIGSFNTSAANVGSGYDPTVDFNFDGSVDSTDFGLLIGSFNTMGPL